MKDRIILIAIKLDSYSKLTLNIGNTHYQIIYFKVNWFKTSIFAFNGYYRWIVSVDMLSY